jgi:hypothetical protein
MIGELKSDFFLTPHFENANGKLVIGSKFQGVAGSLYSGIAEGGVSSL